MRFPWSTKAAAAGIPFSLTDFWAGRFFGGGQSSAGKVVTVDTSMQLSAVWACVRLIARAISSMPLLLYKINGIDSSEVAVNDPLYMLLSQRPNSEMSAVDFWEAMVAALLFGNAFALITRNVVGQVVSLQPLNPARMTVRWDMQGQPIYTYSDSRQSHTWGPDDVLHIKGFTLDGRMGLSTLAYARNSMGSALAAEEASGKIFANGLSLGGAISSDKTVDGEARTRIKASMAEYRGSPNTGKVLVLEGGFTWQAMTMSADDAQLLQTRQWQVEDICRWFDTDPAMIGHTAAGGGKGVTLEQRQLMFWQHTLSPWCRKIEQAVIYSLLPPEKRSLFKVKHDLTELLRADSAGRAALYTSFAQNGIVSRETIRGWEDLPPSGEAGADKLTVQSNLVFIEDLGKQPPAQTPAGFGQTPSPNAPVKPGEPDPVQKQ